jgi:ketosteroid isomerase-like protein
VAKNVRDRDIITRGGIDMADHPDIAVVKKGYEAFNSADIETLSGLIAEDAVQHMPEGKNQFSGDHKGRDNILAMYGKIAELTGGTFRATPNLFTTDGRGTVVVQHDYVGTRDGNDVGQPNALIFRVEGGKIVELTDTTSDLQRYDDNWS